MRGYGSYKKAGMRFARQSSNRNSKNNDNTNTPTHSEIKIGLITAVIFIVLICGLLAASFSS